jgi:hypothetical protein
MTIQEPRAIDRVIEYVAEDRLGSGTFGTAPTNPTFLSFGYVTHFESSIDSLKQELAHLGANASTQLLENYRNIAVSGSLSGTLSYVPYDWLFLPFVTGSECGFGDEPDSISIAEEIDAKYTVYSGVMLTSWEMTLPEEGLANVDVSWVAAHVADPTVTDPAGTGAHAAEPTTDPFTWSGITELKMDTNDTPTTEIDHFVGDIKLSFTNTVNLVKHPTSTLWSEVNGVLVTKRRIGLELTVKDVDDDWFSLVKLGTKQNFKMTVSGQPIQINNIIFPRYARTANPNVLIGESVEVLVDATNFAIQCSQCGCTCPCPLVSR